MKVLELFAGTRSIGKAFEEKGHEVYSIEWDTVHPNIDWYMDISKITAQDILDRFGQPDIIWASFDCTTYSMAAIYRHRSKNPVTGNLDPMTDKARTADMTNEHVMKLIRELDPKFYFIENPRGGMRKMSFMQDLPIYTVTYCFRGDTKIITKEGNFAISELEGKEVELLSTDGKWIKSPIRNYGKQKIVELKLSRSGKEKTIYTTSNHKWFLKNMKIKETSELKNGDLLVYQKTDLQDFEIINESVARGFSFGDGWTLEANSKGFVMFCGEKHEMLTYFDGIGGKRWRDDKDDLEITKIYGYPKSWKKEIPSVKSSPSEIASWIAGYISADGSVSNANGQITLSSSSREHLEKVRELALAIGLDTYSINEYWRKGYGKVETPLYQMTFMRKFFPREMLLRSKHLEAFDKFPPPRHQAVRWKVLEVNETEEVTDVYCAEVPDTHAFTLEDGILTHNCQYGDTRQKPTDIWTNHPEPNFKPMCKRGMPCHVPAPRGSQTGTQGLKNAIEKSRIPDELCRHIVSICEPYFEKDSD